MCLAILPADSTSTFSFSSLVALVNFCAASYWMHEHIQIDKQAQHVLTRALWSTYPVRFAVH